MRPETRAARGGHRPAPGDGLAPPISMSTAYVRDADGVDPNGRVYARDLSPAYDAPERLLGELEGGADACLFSSGMAAVSAVLFSLRPGDHVLLPEVAYWGLHQLAADFSRAWGLDVELVDMTRLGGVADRLRPGATRLLWVESPANPTWAVSDIGSLADLAHAAGARLVVDNTVATPVLTRPIEFGADLVVHSASKALNGHSDVLAGAVVTRRRDAAWERIRSWRAQSGAVLGPMEAWLLARGMQTLFLRVRQGSRSAATIASRLAGHPAVLEVSYPGLETHPGHRLAAEQMTGGFGSMLSVRVKGGEAAARQVVSKVEVLTRATSLGGVESLIEHRASVEVGRSQVPPDLLRISVGVEHPHDLISDLMAALDSVIGMETASDAPAVVDPQSGLERRLRSVVASAWQPLVAARGGTLEVAGVADGVGRLRLLGSPGGLPTEPEVIAERLVERVPGLSAIAFETQAAGAPGAGVEAALSDDPDDIERSSGPTGVADAEDASTDVRGDEARRALADAEHAMAAHGGGVVVEGIEDGRVEIALQGRCVGCARAEVTLRDGLAAALKRLDWVTDVLDVTDHSAGHDPYFRPAVT